MVHILRKNDTILEEKVCYITYSIVKPKNGQPFKRGFIYVLDRIICFDYNGLVVKFTTNEDIAAYSDQIPIVLYKNNDDMCGDYEKETEILSVYSKLYSISMD